MHSMRVNFFGGKMKIIAQETAFQIALRNYYINRLKLKRKQE